MVLKVSCAPAGVGKGSNLGMNTVDLAIHSIAKQNNLLKKIELCRPWPSYYQNQTGKNSHREDLDTWPMRFSYGMNIFDSIEDMEGILYWGDFQHGRDYINQTARRLQTYCKDSGEQRDLESCIDDCRKYFLLKGIPIENLKLAVYGSTLFQNQVTDYADSSYCNHLDRIYKHASFIKLREPYSATKVAQIRGDFNGSYFGVDCALLNRKEELLSLPQLKPSELSTYDGNIGVYLGRYTKDFPIYYFSKFLSKISTELKADLVRIHWDRTSGGLLGKESRKQRLLLPKIHSIPSSTDMTPGDVLKSMSQCQLIITDTYHTALNAWALEIPCICLYEPSPASERNANMGFHTGWRDKRALIYLTHDMADFLIPSTDLLSSKWRNDRAEHISELVRQRAFENVSLKSIKQMAEANRSNLANFLRQAVHD